MFIDRGMACEGESEDNTEELYALIRDQTEQLRLDQERIAELERTIGRLTAENEELKADAVHAKELD